MSDNYTHDELIERGLEEMAYERDLEAQTDRADELADEVARRKADAGAFQRMHVELYEHAVELEEENAALRAKLAAGEGWRPVEGKPPTSEFEMKIRVGAVARIEEHPEVYHVRTGAFLVYWMDGTDWQWRPAPPQE